ncbi:MAG TPA: ACT domain-containing protein [Armatimonadota bacterium]|jgi:glycine cleavage system transcriptional repressor|nr:ACT domain-containing protein [Armatimonadota bacterium]HOM82060.1 ACT domain-containing protein [Armatimonadota bacterium]HPO71242.1 ACT domain-containing protein [Armatimonadota bacterium]HPT99599.1 ACT domain-containing protein [Armatimonadota bacterium]
MPDYIVSVMARDRAGIVAGVSSALYDLGANITHLNQTVVRGYFTIILSASLPEGVEIETVRRRVESAGSPGELQAVVAPYAPVPPAVAGGGEAFILAVLGRDRPGIIARVTGYLAEQGINIEEFTANVVEGNLVLILSVRVPASLDIAGVQSAIEAVGQEFGITASLQHENVFRATSEVHAVARLRSARR